jgi:hypothetical protein
MAPLISACPAKQRPRSWPAGWLGWCAVRSGEAAWTRTHTQRDPMPKVIGKAGNPFPAAVRLPRYPAIRRPMPCRRTKRLMRPDMSKAAQQQQGIDQSKIQRKSPALRGAERRASVMTEGLGGSAPRHIGDSQNPKRFPVRRLPRDNLAPYSSRQMTGSDSA